MRYPFTEIESNGKSCWEENQYLQTDLTKTEKKL